MVVNDQRQESFVKQNIRRSQFIELMRKNSLGTPKFSQEKKMEQALKLPVFDEDQIKELFKARCKDLKIPVKLKQLGKFADVCNEKCMNRKINLENMFVGPITAQLLANWIMLGLIDFTELLLA